MGLFDGRRYRIPSRDGFKQDHENLKRDWATVGGYFIHRVRVVTSQKQQKTKETLQEERAAVIARQAIEKAKQK